jgi:Baseplate J-like protein
VPVQAPPVYSGDLAARTAALLRTYTPWDPTADADLGEGLTKVFAHLAAIVADRVNKAPDKNFLAFLQLVGVSLRPPSTARVPLTFQLAPGTTAGALVPQRTQAAAPPGPGESDPVVFETEQELFAIAAAVAVTATRDPRTDLWAVRGADEATFSVFEGRDTNIHRLYVSSPAFALPVDKDVDVRFSADGVALDWLAALDWEYWNGTEWRSAESSAAAGVVSFAGLRGVQTVDVAGTTAPWLRATLRTTVPRGVGVTARAPREVAQTDVPADSVLTGMWPADPVVPAHPFVAVACAAAFAKPGADVTVRLDGQLTPFTDVGVVWQYSHGGGDWSGWGGSSTVVGDGALAFTVPDDWTANELDGQTRLWLLGMLEMSAPPPVVGATVDYTWNVPFLDGLDVRVDVGREALPPELAFVNQAPVDLNKDFAPFGSTPQLNDTLYLACEEAFAPPPSTVTIHVTVTNEDESATPPPAKPVSLKLAWEFYDGAAGAWAVLGTSTVPPDAGAPPNSFDFADDTAGLANSGTISFTSPETLAPVEVNGVLRHWVRVRIVGGDYGHTARYAKGEIVDPQTGDRQEGLVLEPSTLAPPWLAALRIDYRQETQDYEPAEHVATENDFAVVDATHDVAAGLVPFTPFADLQPTVYVGFDQPLPNVETSLYVAVAEPTYTPELLQRAASLQPPVTTWEWWDADARRWQPLSPQDETRGYVRPGLVTFVAPATLSASAELGHVAYWLRARWERGEYLVSPIVRNVLTNTTWAANATTREDELLGSSNGQPGQTVHLTGTPVLEGEVIEIRELELPPPDELAALAAEIGGDPVRTVLDATGRPAEIWVRWSGMRDFYDSGPRSRHYVVDRVTGVVAFGDGKQGLIPPQGRGNIRAAAYRHGGGLEGNRPAGAITQLKSAVPYVQSVTNVEPARGGTAQETLDDVRERGPRELRHGDRAVTVADFEDLALEASTEVARILAIPSPGAVGLVVVPRSDDRQPAPSLELLDLVQDAVAQRSTPTFNIWVAGPGWIEVTVTAEVAPTQRADPGEVEAAVAARMLAFLNPLHGGPAGTGWDFGRRPHRSDLVTLIESVDGVDHVRALSVVERIDRPAPADGASLVYSGTHAIAMVAGD